MILAGALLLLLYVGSEVSFGGYIFVYAVEYMGMEEEGGYLLNALFWGALAVGRLVAIPWSMLATSARILALDLLGSAASLAIMVVWQRSARVLWATTALFGLLMGPVFPTVMTYAEECTPLSSRHTAALVVGAAAGEMLLPAILALLFARPDLPTTPPSDSDAPAPQGAEPGEGARFGGLPWVLALDALLSLAAFGALVRAGERTKRRRREEEEEEEEEDPRLVANAA